MSDRDRRVVLWGATVIALAGVGRLAPPTWRRIDLARQEATQKALLVTRAEDLVRNKETLEALLAARSGALVALAPRLLPGVNAADASAELTAMLARWCREYRVLVEQVDPAPDSLAGVFRRVAVRLVARGDFEGLVGLLSLIEHGQVLLSVADFNIARDGEGETPDQRLRFDLTVEGWMLERSAR